jgi:HEAT repeat protein
MRIFIVALLFAGLGGCSKPQPTLSGGKPISHWIERLSTSPDAKERKEAAFKLGNVGPTDAAVLPALQGGIKDADPAVRCEVILALVKCGPAAEEAVPALIELRDRDRDPRVRGYAAKALEKIRSKE